jgi:hypothetical protein
MSKAPQGQVLQRRTGWFAKRQVTPPSLMVAQPLTEEEALAELKAQRDAEEAAKRAAEDAVRIREEARRAKEEARRIREEAKRAESEARREEKARQAEESRRKRQEAAARSAATAADASSPHAPPEPVVRLRGQKLNLSLSTAGCVAGAACICVLVLVGYSLGRRSTPSKDANGGAPPAASIVRGESDTVRTPLLPAPAKPKADARPKAKTQPTAQAAPTTSNPDLSELLKSPAARKANLVTPNQPAAVEKAAAAPMPAVPAGPAAEDLNYLQIESFHVTRYRSGDQLKDDVEAVRAYLGQRGIATFARRLGNGYVLFGEQGFPPGAQTEVQREAFRKKVEDLGKEYRKSGGLYEFKNCLFVSHATTRAGQPG